ncbi:uncharacterized protein LOC143545454 [Bidens hawaiensis]|uniref:uncharacterized protein LOC143545454 n=1 Tax=Bidens hawaiensis TaxID=980011 RepID=UPI00404939B9
MKAKKKVEGDYKQQYSLLRDYAAELVDKNPGSTLKIEVGVPSTHEATTRQFKRIYVCLAALKQGFKALDRNLIGLDGAFMKGIFPELMAEDLEIGSNSRFTFMSDRQKGLLQAIQTLFPCAEHRYCLRHIHENMKLAGYRGFAISDVMINNMCEVYNGKIVEARDRPIISALECVREYLMSRIVTVLGIIDKCEGLLTLGPHNCLKQSRNKQIFTMCSGMEGIYMRLVFSTGIPCRHVVAALWFMAASGGRVGALESWVHPVYTMNSWNLVYSFKVNPINGMTLWTKCEAPTTIVAPKHHTMAGRPKKAKKRSIMEKDDIPTTGKLTRKNTFGACSRCGSTGHNVRTCTCPLKKKGKKAA